MQGDRLILNAIKLAGGTFEWKDEVLRIPKSNIRPFEFDATDAPDLFPPLVVLAAAASGVSRIKGTNRLINKESNRALVLQQEFGKLGLKVEVEDNEMLVHGSGKLNSGEVNSNNDHRIAMAAAVAASLTDNKLIINQAEAVSKSYPDFWKLV